MLYGLYHLDQQLFTKLFCVNKSKPKMHCNGSCMLSKIDKQSSKDQEKPILPDLSQIQSIFIYIVQHAGFELNFIQVSEDQQHFTHYENFYNSQYLKDIFHPPLLV